MPPSRNNENQPPHRGSFRTPSTPHRNAESRRVESNIRDAKADIKQEEGIQAQTGPDQGYIGAVNRSTLTTYPDNTASPMSGMALLKLSTPLPPPVAGRTENWVAQHGTPEDIPLDIAPTGTPNRAIDPRPLRHPLPPRPQSPVDFYPSMATPGMAPSRDHERAAHASLGRSDGPQSRQLPSFRQVFGSRGPPYNNDTPTSADDSGMEDQLHSPQYAVDISPTNAMSSRVAEPLIAAAIPFNPTPAVQAHGSMPPPNFQSRNPGRRQTLMGQARRQPYPQTPGSQLHRIPRSASTQRNFSAPVRRPPIDHASHTLEYGRDAQRTALGNGRPIGAINGSPRPESTAEITQRYISEGRPPPSVLEPADPVGFTYMPPRSGPASPLDQFTPAARVTSTPRTTFPGETFTPRVTVPGNMYAQTPTATPGITTAIDREGNAWDSIRLPRFYGEQVDIPMTPGAVSTAAQVLAAARIETSLDRARPPRVVVPTPGDSYNHLRYFALEAIMRIATDDGANFADPAHFEIFEHYVEIALSEGSTSPILNGNLQIIYQRFVDEMSAHAAYLRINGGRIPNEIQKSIETALKRAIDLWGNTSLIAETFRLRLDGSIRLMMEQHAEQGRGA